MGSFMDTLISQLPPVKPEGKPGLRHPGTGNHFKSAKKSTGICRRKRRSFTGGIVN